MLTEERYEMVLLMLKGGATVEQICTIGLKPETIDRVKRSNGSYQKYKKLHGNEVLKGHRRGNSKKETIVVHEQTVTVVADKYMMEEMRKQTELLQTISKKLAFFVDELTK